MPGLNLPKKRMIAVEASIIKRLIAFIIDFFIVVFIASPIINVLAGTIQVNTSGNIVDSFTDINSYFMSNPEIISLRNTINFLFTVVAFLYFFLFELKLKQTIGKMIFKLKVVNEDKKIKDVKFWQFAVRNLFLLLNVIIFADLIFLVLKNQRLSDIMAKTRVIEVISA